MAFDKSFAQLNIYNHFDYWVKETIFERQLWARGNSSCFINWHCVEAYTVRPLVGPGLFDPFPDWWCSYELSEVLFVPTPMVMAYYSNVVVSLLVLQLSYLIFICEFCVLLLFLFHFQHLSVDLFVLGDTLQVSNIFVRGEYYSHYLTVFTASWDMSEIFRSCPILLSIL